MSSDQQEAVEREILPGVFLTNVKCTWRYAATEHPEFMVSGCVWNDNPYPVLLERVQIALMPKERLVAVDPEKAPTGDYIPRKVYAKVDGCSSHEWHAVSKKRCSYPEGTTLGSLEDQFRASAMGHVRSKGKRYRTELVEVTPEQARPRKRR